MVGQSCGKNERGFAKLQCTFTSQRRRSAQTYFLLACLMEKRHDQPCDVIGTLQSWRNDLDGFMSRCKISALIAAQMF
jgi:hypothetical protein